MLQPKRTKFRKKQKGRVKGIAQRGHTISFGSFGIRSNGINADRIRSGLLNINMIKSRAKAREVTTDQYMKGNLLHNEVKAEDVAKAFFHLAVSKKTTGAVLTVDGGNIAASLR